MSRSSENRRVWRIAHSEASLGWGGQEHRVMAELVGFQKRGSQVWLIAPSESQVAKRAAPASIPVYEQAFHQRLFMPLHAVKLARWLKKNRIEIVNPHSSRDGWLVGLAARIARTPLLIRSRHIDVSYPTPSVSRHAFTTFADHVLTTSQKITDHFQEIFHLTPQHITTLPTGIDIDSFHPQGVRAQLPVQSGEGSSPVVGMVSVLRSWKGHPLFFDAIRLLRQRGKKYQFVVVGGGAPMERYTDLAKQHGVFDDVHFTGHLENIPEVLRALDVLCIPSLKHEGVPQIGLQALACGTAVVGSECGGIPEIIRRGETGRIFPIGDAEAFAQCIIEAVEQPQETQRMIQTGRAMVEQRHSLDVMLNQLEDIYHRHLG